MKHDVYIKEFPYFCTLSVKVTNVSFTLLFLNAVTGGRMDGKVRNLNSLLCGLIVDKKKRRYSLCFGVRYFVFGPLWKFE